jgi:hypothetical protein
MGMAIMQYTYWHQYCEKLQVYVTYEVYNLI